MDIVNVTCLNIANTGQEGKELDTADLHKTRHHEVDKTGSREGFLRFTRWNKKIACHVAKWEGHTPLLMEMLMQIPPHTF